MGLRAQGEGQALDKRKKIFPLGIKGRLGMDQREGVGGCQQGPEKSRESPDSLCEIEEFSSLDIFDLFVGQEVWNM